MSKKFSSLVIIGFIGLWAMAQTAAPAGKAAAHEKSATHAAAKPAAMPMGGTQIETASGLKWKDFMPGLETAVVNGDPDKAGTYTIRIRGKAGTRLPAHWHPTDENVTILSGTFMVGMGDDFDESKMKTMQPGDFVHVAKLDHHYALCKTDIVVQVHGPGPFKIMWVKPPQPAAKPAEKPAK